MGYAVDLKEHIHYRWMCEDYKHNMFILNLNEDIEKWMEENINGKYNIEYAELHIHHHLGPNLRTLPRMILENGEDAVAFKLRWI